MLLHAPIPWVPKSPPCPLKVYSKWLLLYIKVCLGLRKWVVPMGASEAGPLWVEDWTNNHRVKKPIGEAAQLGEVVHAEAIARLTLLKRSWVYSPTHPRPSLWPCGWVRLRLSPGGSKDAGSIAWDTPLPFVVSLLGFWCLLFVLLCAVALLRARVALLRPPFPPLPACCVLPLPVVCLCCFPSCFLPCLLWLTVLAPSPSPPPFHCLFGGWCACVCVCLQPVTVSQKENNQGFQIHAGGLVVSASASSTKGFVCMWHWYPATYVHGNRARPKTRQAEFQRTSDRYGTHVWVVFLFSCTSILTCQPCSSTCWTLRTQ